MQFLLVVVVIVYACICLSFWLFAAFLLVFNVTSLNYTKSICAILLLLLLHCQRFLHVKTNCFTIFLLARYIFVKICIWKKFNIQKKNFRNFCIFFYRTKQIQINNICSSFFIQYNFYYLILFLNYFLIISISAISSWNFLYIYY